jgi:putative MATE family efflux protein
VIAQIGAALVYAAWVVAAVKALGVERRPHLASIRRLAALGRDLMVRTIAARVTIAVATAVAARIGTDDVAAHEVAFAIWLALALGLDAIAIAGQAMTGHRLGADRPEEARAAGRRMVELGVVVGVGFGLLVVALRPVLPELFTDDPAVIALTGFLLWWVAALQPMCGVVFVLDGVLIGAGDVRFLARAMILATLVFTGAAVAVLALDLGIGWLWGAVAIWMLVRLVTLSARFAAGRWVVTGARAP